jgi:hypothetical protein
MLIYVILWLKDGNILYDIYFKWQCKCSSILSHALLRIVSSQTFLYIYILFIWILLSLTKNTLTLTTRNSTNTNGIIEVFLFTDINFSITKSVSVYQQKHSVGIYQRNPRQNINKKVVRWRVSFSRWFFFSLLFYSNIYRHKFFHH